MTRLHEAEREFRNATSAADLRKAYRRAALNLHPNKRTDVNAKVATAEFQHLGKLYERHTTRLDRRHGGGHKGDNGNRVRREYEERMRREGWETSAEYWARKAHEDSI